MGTKGGKPCPCEAFGTQVVAEEVAAVSVLTLFLGPSPQPPSWASRFRPQCPVSFLQAGREVGMLLAVLIQVGPQAISDTPDLSGVTSSDAGRSA